MPINYAIYLTAWTVACLVALALMLPRRRSLELCQRSYWVGLMQGWKLITFLLAAVALTVMAPYTIDPTWDYVDAGFMSLLTYTTAPWTVATLYLALRKQRPLVHVYIAVCIWMFSVSWSYDLYILLRDGRYPVTWLPNIFLSSILYLAAGLFWNLEYIEGRGAIFAFMDKDWPALTRSGKFTRVMWYTLPFILLVAAMVIPFLFK
jgi:hypothetical protein